MRWATARPDLTRVMLCRCKSALLTVVYYGSVRLSKDKLLMALERALVDVVNKAGVDINRAANDDYYATLLPYVAGLGPRKAQVVIRKIHALVSPFMCCTISTLFLIYPNREVTSSIASSSSNPVY